ncbi:hypothetical protein [Rhodococcus maanshanensis]|uniref:Pullulanase n=1 Tax=Rhodococcus maanshanensis TaxID=183556 RepID=A0A1H7WQ37_9NOCA|nr:hypothetical protein [Rhodococcus maanshanensis]SEM23612.1 hypothetical protein SAMN05444583_12827 [Rhodococcus maanshanensis]
MGLVEYSFGTGEGAPRDWVSEADLDLGGIGAPDAVSLDFDGDGLFDDAMWDSDGDGGADRSVLDVGEEGRYFEDASGAGVWDLEVPPPAAEAGHGLRWTDAGGVERTVPGGEDGRPVEVDLDLDGAPDVAVIDTDGDSLVDVSLVRAGRAGPYAAVEVDERSDGAADVTLSDTDGDGRLDTVDRGPG